MMTIGPSSLHFPLLQKMESFHFEKQGYDEGKISYTKISTLQKQHVNSIGKIT